MDCETFHLDLPDLIYGELQGERKQNGEAHMAGCPACTELVSDLQTVRTAQPRHTPTALLNARIKLAARDELLGESSSALGWGGALHGAAALVLAACVCLAGFALGIAYQREQPKPALPGASSPPTAYVPRPAPPMSPGPESIEINDPVPNRPPGLREPGAYQRFLEEAASGLLERGDWAKAREFFQAAVLAAPQGERAAAAMTGAAESLLRSGDADGARAELEAVRRKVIANMLRGDAALMERILALEREAGAN